MAIGQGYERMLLMDQDALALVGPVQQLGRGANRRGGTRVPAVLCPLFIESDPSGQQSVIPTADIAVESCTNADGIVKLIAWKAVGFKYNVRAFRWSWFAMSSNYGLRFGGGSQ